MGSGVYHLGQIKGAATFEHVLQPISHQNSNGNGPTSTLQTGVFEGRTSSVRFSDALMNSDVVLSPDSEWGRRKSLLQLSSPSKTLRTVRDRESIISETCSLADGMGPESVEFQFRGPAVWLEIQPAPVKTMARMREKLHEYAHDEAGWPLCAHILDPVRCSIVCNSAAEMLDVVRAYIYYIFSFFHCMPSTMRDAAI